jgi:hypothetical protein
MSALAKRTIQELLMRFELEPTLEDVYVEGRFDRDVLQPHATKGRLLRAIYEVDAIDVPNSLLIKHNLTEGNKQRLIVLARELAAQSASAKYVCLVDKDLDHWFGALDSTRQLKWTKYCAIEMHFFTPEVVRDIVMVSGRANIGNFEDFMASLRLALCDLYALRLVDRQLSLNLKWVTLGGKYLSRLGDRIFFDSEKYTTSLLTSCGHGAKLPAFRDAVGAWRACLNKDCRQQTRGHDFVTLLAWAVLTFCSQREHSSVAALEKLFIVLSRHTNSLAEEIEP